MQKTASTQITVYFPAPPGGCYSDFNAHVYRRVNAWARWGTGFVGNGGGVISSQGKPSQDVLYSGSDNRGFFVGPRDGWTIRDLVIKVDDSVDASASFTHRWPGEVGSGWNNQLQAAISLRASAAEFTCGDIGQNILVKGAGAGGADLSTTISSVSPCWHNVGGGLIGTATAKTVTLAASAGTNVSKTPIVRTLRQPTFR